VRALRRRWINSAIAVLAAVGGGLVGAELLVRVLDLFSEQREIASGRAPEIGPAGDRSEAIRTQIHPFLGWSIRPGTPAEFVLDDPDKVFPDGQLTPWVEQSLERNAFGLISSVADYRNIDASHFVVGVFGGSVAAHLTLLAGDALTAAIARRFPQLEGSIVLLNFGEGGYKQPQQLNALSEMALLGVPLDVVINLDGVNEAALGAQDCRLGHHPLMPSRRHYRSVAKMLRGDSVEWTLRSAEILHQQRAEQRWVARVSTHPILRHSELAKAVAGIFAKRHRVRGVVLEDELQREAQQAGDAEEFGFVAELPHEQGMSVEACLELTADLWERSSLLMGAVAERIDASYVHFLQPNLHVPASKPLTREEREVAGSGGPWAERVAAGHPLLRSRGERLVSQGVHFVDLTMVFAERSETVYWDACCHINHFGNVHLAEAIADHIPAPE
jgi:hypothetical protein